MRGLLLLVGGYHDGGDFIRLLGSKARGLRVAMTKLPHVVYRYRYMWSCRGLLRPRK
jgi:hypothetical protein